MPRNLVEMAAEIENEHVKKAVVEGKKIVGYCCLATPREVLDAAGIFPYRLKALGSSGTEMADAYLSRFNCGFCRSCLQMVLDGKYDFLYGAVETNGCDHLRGMFDNWQHAKPSNFFHYIRVPHVIDDISIDWFSEEISMLREAVGSHFGVKIKDEDLEEQLEMQERITAKLRSIYESRWIENPPFSGAQIMALMILEGSMPAADFDKLLDEVINENKTAEGLKPVARIFLGGSATDEINIIAELETLGGIVVADSLCFGGRAFRERTKDKMSPERKLAKAYLENLLCTRMFDDYPNRLSFIRKMIEDSAADGAVFFNNKFCDIHGIENVRLRMDLEKDGIPVLLLEKEYGAAADIGRLKTRVQAFLERIGK